MTPAADPTRRTDQALQRLLSWPALIFVVLFFVAPLLLLLRVSFYEGGGRSGLGIGGMYIPDTWTLSAYAKLFADSYFTELLMFTFKLGIYAATISIVLGYALALLIRPLSGGLRVLAMSAVFLPKLANVLVIVYGLELLLGDFGAVNKLLAPLNSTGSPIALLHNFTGTLIGEVYLILPYAVLLLVAALDRIPPLLAPAARGLGAGPMATFLKITLPLTLPTLIVTYLLCLIFGIGAFVAPAILGGPNEFTLSVDIQRQAFENLNWPRAAAESIMMLICVSVLCVTYGIGATAAKRFRS